MLNTKFWSCERFVRNDLAERKIRSRRLASEEFLEFKQKLGLDLHENSFYEQDTISALQVTFEGEIMYIECCVQNKRFFWTQVWSRN